MKTAKKQLFKITVSNWAEHNPGRRGSFKKTMIANNFCHDNKLSVLPVSHRWLFLGLVLSCGDHNSDTLVMSERQLRALLESSKSVLSALTALQSLRLVTFTQEDVPPLIEMKEEKEEKERKKVRKGSEQDQNGHPEQAELLPKESFSPKPASHPLLEIWNSHCAGLPKAKSLSAERRKKCEALWKQEPNEAYWIEVIKKLNTSDFCTGKNDRGWIANFDFFINGKSHLRAMEGQYDNRDNKGFFMTNAMKVEHNSKLKIEKIRQALGVKNEREPKDVGTNSDDGDLSQHGL